MRLPGWRLPPHSQGRPQGSPLRPLRLPGLAGANPASGNPGRRRSPTGRRRCCRHPRPRFSRRSAAVVRRRFQLGGRPADYPGRRLFFDDPPGEGAHRLIIDHPVLVDVVRTYAHQRVVARRLLPVDVGEGIVGVLYAKQCADVHVGWRWRCWRPRWRRRR